MTQPSNPTKRELLAECQALLLEVSRRPGYIKLLLYARDMLKILAAYKATRNSGFKRSA